MPAVSPTETTREGLFASTRWTMVLDAGESQTPPAQALSALYSKTCEEKRWVDGVLARKKGLGL